MGNAASHPGTHACMHLLGCSNPCRAWAPCSRRGVSAVHAGVQLGRPRPRLRLCWPANILFLDVPAGCTCMGTSCCLGRIRTLAAIHLHAQAPEASCVTRRGARTPCTCMVPDFCQLAAAERAMQLEGQPSQLRLWHPAETLPGSPPAGRAVPAASRPPPVGWQQHECAVLPGPEDARLAGGGRPQAPPHRDPGRRLQRLAS